MNLKNIYLSPTTLVIRLEATSFIAASGGTIGGGGYEDGNDENLAKENDWSWNDWGEMSSRWREKEGLI